MKVTTVTAARLVNTGNYENTRWELTAELEGDESAVWVADTLARLLVQIARVERDRRYPDERDRRDRLWVEEDEWEERARMATERAARAASRSHGEPEST